MADPKIAGCGAFGDLGTHGLDILMWISGCSSGSRAAWNWAPKRYPDCDEFGEALIRFKSGVVGTLAAGWDDVANPVNFLVSGTEGHACVVAGKLYFQSAKVAGADGKEPWTALPAPVPRA